MRVSLTLLVTMAVILAILLPEMEAAATRRGKAARRARGRSQVRARAGRFAGKRLRRGRQEEVEEVDPEAEADLNAVDGEVAGDEAMEELYNGCDWKTNIGGFLNFCKWRKWCADNQGITDFGPYGGVPIACPPEEEGADEAAGEEEEAAPEARRRARARRGRKAAAKSARRTSRSKKAGRKGRKSQKKTRRFRG